MRVLPAAALLAASISSYGQSREGIYRPANGSSAQWRINEHHTLLWNGSAYLPVGLRIGPTEAEISGAKAAGVTDVLLDLPIAANWRDGIARAEAAGLRYLVAVGSMAPMAKGWTIEPAAYRVGGITKTTKIELHIPGATSALTVLSAQQYPGTEKLRRVPIENGRLSMEVKPPNDLDHVLLIYPEMNSGSQTDYWEGFDEHRDRVLANLKSAEPGPGLRGIVNPLGSLISLGAQSGQFVPTSPYFQAEYKTFLERKYKTVKSLQDSWMVTGAAFDKFEEFARLVPLWSGTRGIFSMWDPKTDRLYPVESRRSTVWSDILVVTNGAAARRYQRLVRSIRQVVNVPIVQEWAGWTAPYESDSPTVDGLAMRVSGTSPSAVAESGSRVTSSILRWPGPGWLVASDIDLGRVAEPANELAHVLDDLSSLGARAWFVRNNPAIAKAVGSYNVDMAAAQWSPQPIFFPENALNPAIPQRLAGGRWWLPSPAAGNRIDLGTKFFAYRLQDGDTHFLALWGSGPPARVKLRAIDPKAITVASTDGSDPKPKVVRGGLEVTVSEFPLIIQGTAEVPIPEPALVEAVFRFEHLLKLAESVGRDTTEESFFFKEAMAGFERNPAGSYTSLRTHFWRLNAKMGGFTWIEAEATRDTSFSEASTEAGCSNAGALNLRTPLSGSSVGSYHASWNPMIRQAGEMEVWIAARIPEHLRANARVTVGGQQFEVKGEPISHYADGFGWYRLGTVTFEKAGSAKARIDVAAPDGADLALDVILIHPGKFIPSGITPPDAVQFPPTPAK